MLQKRKDIGKSVGERGKQCAGGGWVMEADRVTPRLRGSAAGPEGLPVPSSRSRGGLSTGEVRLLGALGNDGFQGIGAKLFASGSATEPLRVNRPTSVE